MHLAVGALNAVGPLNNDDVIVMNDTNPLGAASAEPSSGKPSEQIELRIGGMTCPHCPPAVEKAVAAVPGVMSARVNLASNTARIRYEPARTKLADVVQAIRSIGYVPGTATLRFPIKNMHCSSCSIRIELALQMTPGVVHAWASLGSNAVDVEYDPEQSLSSNLKMSHSIRQKQRSRKSTAP